MSRKMVTCDIQSPNKSYAIELLDLLKQPAELTSNRTGKLSFKHVAERDAGIV